MPAVEFDNRRLSWYTRFKRCNWAARCPGTAGTVGVTTPTGHTPPLTGARKMRPHRILSVRTTSTATFLSSANQPAKQLQGRSLLVRAQALLQGGRFVCDAADGVGCVHLFQEVDVCRSPLSRMAPH